jgi:hypothetical protein
MSEISRLKRRARRLYLRIRERRDIGCGAHLAEFIRPDIGVDEAELGRIFARLREIDPDCPKTSQPLSQGALPQP